MKEVDLGGPKWPSDFADAAPSDSALAAPRDCSTTCPGKRPRSNVAREEK